MFNQKTKTWTTTRGYKKFLKTQNLTEAQLDQEWKNFQKALDDGCAYLALTMFMDIGLTDWRQLSTQRMPELVGLSDRMYADKKQRELKKEQDRIAKAEAEAARQYYYDHTEEILVDKIDKGIKLTEEEIDDLYNSCHIYEETPGEKHRWTQTISTVFNLKDGRYLRLDWEEGLTETCDSYMEEQPYFVEKHTKEITIQVTEWIPAKEQTNDAYSH